MNKPHHQLAPLAGRFVVFEGPDGCGKTTQIERLENACKADNITVTRVREPGGTAVGEHVRQILLSNDTGDLAMTTEMLLYMAARAQLVESVIRPALDRGDCVLADRFVPSTRAYQGDAGGLADDDIKAAARIATGGLCPDLIILIDIDEATAATRLGTQRDRIESRSNAFQQKVRASYLKQAKTNPGKWTVIDGTADIETVWHRVQAALSAWLDTLATNPPNVASTRP